jgi:hypothetical protein
LLPNQNQHQQLQNFHHQPIQFISLQTPTQQPQHPHELLQFAQAPSILNTLQPAQFQLGQLNTVHPFQQVAQHHQPGLTYLQSAQINALALAAQQQQQQQQQNAVNVI